MDDLWPSDFISKIRTMPPVNILKEQVSILSERTSNFVQGSIESVKTNDNEFLFRFSLTCPALGYTFRIFYLRYPIEMYPLTIQVEEGILEIQEGKRPNIFVIKNQAGYMTVLKKIFASEKIKNVVNSLLSQV